MHNLNGISSETALAAVFSAFRISALPQKSSTALTIIMHMRNLLCSTKKVTINKTISLRSIKNSLLHADLREGEREGGREGERAKKKVQPPKLPLGRSHHI